MTMENFRIRSRRSLVWWGRAPQTHSMREGFRSRSPCSDTRPVAVTAFGQAFARYQDPMDAGSPMRTRGLSVSFCYVSFTWALSIMRAVPVSLWSSLRFTLSYWLCSS